MGFCHVNLARIPFQQKAFCNINDDWKFGFFLSTVTVSDINERKRVINL